MVTPRPQVRMHLVVTDVGARGAEVMITTEIEDEPKLIGEDSIEAAFAQVAAHTRRLLWGADQPPDAQRSA